MKKERVIASKKTKTITKSKAIIDFGEDLPIFSGVSNVDIDNLNLSITTNIKDLLAPLTQQIRELRDFLNFHTKCMYQKPKNFDNSLSGIICDKDLVVENEILKVKLEKADKENTFLRGEFKDLTVLLNAKIGASPHNFKPNTKECLLQENFDTQYNHNLAFKLTLSKVICYAIKITFQINRIFLFRKLTVI